MATKNSVDPHSPFEYDYEDPRLDINGFVVDYFVWRISQSGFEWYERPELPFGVQPEHLMMRQLGHLFESRHNKDFDEMIQALTADEDLIFPRYCQVVDSLSRAERSQSNDSMSYGKMVGLISFGGALATSFSEKNKRTEIFKISLYTSKYIEKRIRSSWARDHRSWDEFMRTASEIMEDENNKKGLFGLTRSSLLLVAGTVAVVGILFSTTKFLIGRH